jgi:hypothetical protein
MATTNTRSKNNSREVAARWGSSGDRRAISTRQVDDGRICEGLLIRRQ